MNGTVDTESPRGRLMIALAEIADEGRRTPCQGPDRDLWTSDYAAEREAATWRCAGCPVIDLCHADIESIPRGRRYHVWAGRDWTPIPRPNRKTTEEEAA